MLLTLPEKHPSLLNIHLIINNYDVPPFPSPVKNLDCERKQNVASNINLMLSLLICRNSNALVMFWKCMI